VKRVRGKNVLWLYMIGTLLVSLAATISISYASPDPVVSISPLNKIANPYPDPLGEPTVQVRIASAPPGVAGWEIKLKWDVTLTEWPPTVTPGNFLSNGTTIPVSDIAIYTDYGGGFIQLTQAVTNNITTPLTSGNLVSIKFRVKTTGITTLHLYDTKVWTVDFKTGQITLLTHTTADGLLFTTKPVASFDIWPKRYVFESENLDYQTWSTWWELESYTPLTQTTDKYVTGGMTSRIKKVYVPGDANKTLTFDATASFDPDNVIDPTPGPIGTFMWDFGDGTPAQYGNVTTHNFTAYRQLPYSVTLTVQDDDFETYSETQTVLVYRDLVVIDIWPSMDWQDSLNLDVFHGQMNPYDGFPDMVPLVTVADLGSMPETFTIQLFADKDLTTIGDEYVLYPDVRTRTLFPGVGSGWSLWYVWDLRAPGQGGSGWPQVGGWAGVGHGKSLEDIGEYTLTAEATLSDTNTANNVLQQTVNIHARAEVTEFNVPSKKYSISKNGATFDLSATLKNMEPSSVTNEIVYAKVVYEIADAAGNLRVFKTSTWALDNGQKSGWIHTYWFLTLADVGVYDITVYSEFGWDGVNFPFIGTQATTITVVITE
jgi:hypothetical protein